jgi:hypothetical protein
MKVRMNFYASLIGIFFLIGFGLLGYSLWSVRRSLQAAAWPTASGTITHLEVLEHPGGGNPNIGTTGSTYEVQVRYAYAVDGVAYEGSRLAFGFRGSGSQTEQCELYRKLKQAKTVDVHYDPSDPAVSCLSAGLNWSIQLGLVFSIVWLAFVFGFTVLWWRSSRGDPVSRDNLRVA